MLSSVLALVPFSLSPTHAVVTAVMGRNMILGCCYMLGQRLLLKLCKSLFSSLFSSPTTKSSETSFQQLMHCIECTRVPQLIPITIPLSLATVFKSFKLYLGAHAALQLLLHSTACKVGHGHGQTQPPSVFKRLVVTDYLTVLLRRVNSNKTAIYPKT